MVRSSEMEVDVLSQCKDYFYNLNSISPKFAKDIENTKEAYQDLWNTLSYEEQSQVINESIITPAAVLKYAHIQDPSIEDTSSRYSWFTRSQLDLFTSYKPNEIVHKNNNNCASQLPSMNPRTVSKKLGTEMKKKDGTDENKHSLFGKLQSHKSSILKPKAPPPPPPGKKAVAVSGHSKVDRSSFIEHNDECTEVSNDIRKTGFDFLDNW